MKLTDNNITLKPLNLDDSDVLFQLTDKNRNYLRKWLPWVDATKTIEDSKSFIQSTGDNKDAAHFGIWFNENLVGVIGYHFIHKSNRKGHIGYWLDEKSQGKGFMTAACRLLIKFGFEELNLNRIEISCAVDNDKSCAIPERLGFQQEGIFRQAEWLYDHFVDHKFYALLKKDWKE